MLHSLTCGSGTAQSDSDVIGNKGGEFTSVSMFDFTSVPKTLGRDAAAHDTPIDRVRICQGSFLDPTLCAM